MLFLFFINNRGVSVRIRFHFFKLQGGIRILMQLENFMIEIYIIMMSGLAIMIIEYKRITERNNAGNQ